LPDKSDKSSKSERGAGSDHSQCVLIVDGDANFRSVIGAELKAQGYTVSMATNGRKAFELFPSMPFGLVIADSSPQGGNGLELIRDFAEKNLQVPVLLVSSSREESAEDMKRQGAADFLHKPVTARDVADRIRRIKGDGDTFRYFLNVRRTLLVASWVGELRVADSDQVKRCLEEISSAQPKYVIFSLHGFTGYDTVLAGEIVKFQEAIRATGAWLVLCGLEWNMREQMASKGLVVEGEIHPTLKDALQYVLEIGMKQ
jgi:DNA-binding NtrC family response regulator